MRCSYLSVALTCLVGPLAAQEQSEAVFCEDLLAEIPTLLDIGVGVAFERDVTAEAIGAVEGGCAYQGIEITSVMAEGEGFSSSGLDFNFVQRIGGLTLTGVELDRLMQGAYPSELFVEITDFYSGLPRTSAYYNFADEVRAAYEAIDIRLAARIDVGAGQIVIDELEFGLERDWVVGLTAVIAGIDGTSKDRILQSAPTASVTELTLDVSGDGIFELAAMEPIGEMLAFQDNPREAFFQMVSEAQAVVSDAPSSLIDADSRAEVVALLDDLPHPTGALRVEISAEPGLGMARFAPFAVSGPPSSVDEVWPALDGVRIAVEYAPE